MNNLKYWVWIVMALGPANSRIWDVLRGYDSIEDAYNWLSSGKDNNLTPLEEKSFRTTDLTQAEKIIEFCNENQISVICYDDEGFPQRLRDIYNPPAVLFMYGNLDFIDNSVTLAVVGARKPSEYSIKVAEIICTKLSEVGTVIVSGFAYGIDSIAHKSALQCKTKTVAVLASGIDYDYPQGNAKFKKIIGKCGAVITEYFPGTKPVHEYFKQRNRLISGISLGILVVEASSKSGSLNTASHALQQGRDIFCIPPHDIYDNRYSGVINLLRDGAISVFSHLDIMYEYYENFSHKLNYINPYEQYVYKSESAVFSSEKISKPKKIRDNKKSTEPENIENNIEVKEIDLSDLDDTQVKIVELLKEKTFLSDELSVKLNIDISQILTSLTELELLGIVKSLAGKRYSL